MRLTAVVVVDEASVGSRRCGQPVQGEDHRPTLTPRGSQICTEKTFHVTYIPRIANRNSNVSKANISCDT